LQEDPTTFYPSDTVRAESHATLEAVVGILKKWHGIKKLTVEGNTCTNGELSWNKALSRDRATAVKRFLVERCGVPASKLSIEGHGPSKLLAEAHSQRRRNRRVEFLVILTGLLRPTRERCIEPPHRHVCPPRAIG